jgi:ABC-type phosphate transport system ATPase subunit
LDPTTVLLVEKTLKEYKHAIVWVTHYAEQAARVGTKFILLERETSSDETSPLLM